MEQLNDMEHKFYCEDCEDNEEKPCQSCCEHEFDFDCGGMCIICDREDWYNFLQMDCE